MSEFCSNKYQAFIDKERTVDILLIFFVAFFVYGILISFLGYYYDGWVFYNEIARSDDIDFVNVIDDRPMLGFFQGVFSNLLGIDNPVLWQIYAILMRALATAGVYLFLREFLLCRTSATLVALLFLVYPGFSQQHAAMIYGTFWLAFSFSIFSLALNLYLFKIKANSIYFLYLTLAVLFMFLGFMSYEALLSFELIRTVTVLFILNKRSSGISFPNILKYLFPFFLVSGIYLVWRVFFYSSSRNILSATSVLDDLQNDPIGWVTERVSKALGDFVEILLASWGETVTDSFVYFADKGTLLSFAMAIVIGIFLYFWFVMRASSDTDDVHPTRKIFWGIAFFILGLSVVWFSDRNLMLTTSGNRYIILGMLGASLVIFSIVYFLVESDKKRKILVIFLISIATAWQVRASNEYRHEWNNQKTLFWQLYWRAPDLGIGTTVWIENDVWVRTKSGYGDYSFSVPLNMLYEKNLRKKEFGYNMYRLNRHYRTLSHEKITYAMRGGYSFTGSSKDSLLIQYKQPSCMKVVNQESASKEYYSYVLDSNSKFSDLSLIKNVKREPPGAFIRLFGKEPEKTWCYYYQKASLSAQFSEWEEVLNLEKLALKYKLEPMLDGSEWLPFIEAHKRLGNNSQVNKLMNLACDKSKYDVTPRACD